MTKRTSQPKTGEIKSGHATPDRSNPKSLGPESLSPESLSPGPLAIAHHMYANEGTGPAWDIEILDVGEGSARLAMVLRPDMLNGHRTAHGGMLFALADTAFAYACNSRNQMTTAHHASISFLSPGREGERLIADAKEEALKGRSGVYKVMVTGDDDRVIAVFQGLSRALGRCVLEQDGDSYNE